MTACHRRLFVVALCAIAMLLFAAQGSYAAAVVKRDDANTTTTPAAATTTTTTTPTTTTTATTPTTTTTTPTTTSTTPTTTSTTEQPTTTTEETTSASETTTDPTTDPTTQSSATPTTTVASHKSGSSGSKLSGGAIAGIAVGSLAAIIFVSAIIYTVRKDDDKEKFVHPMFVDGNGNGGSSGSGGKNVVAAAPVASRYPDADSSFDERGATSAGAAAGVGRATSYTQAPPAQGTGSNNYYAGNYSQYDHSDYYGTSNANSTSNLLYANYGDSNMSYAYPAQASQMPSQYFPGDSEYAQENWPNDSKQPHYN